MKTNAKFGSNSEMRTNARIGTNSANTKMQYLKIFSVVDPSIDIVTINREGDEIKDAPLSLDEMSTLAAMNFDCFPEDEKMETDSFKNAERYYHRILSSLAPQFKKSISTGADSIGLFGKSYRNKMDQAQKNKKINEYQDRITWYLVVYFESSLNKKRHIMASCLIKRENIYGALEVHEVCKNRIGERRTKKVCASFIKDVFDYFINSEDCKSIRIYCQRINKAACACYQSLLETEGDKNHIHYHTSYHETPSSLGFVYYKNNKIHKTEARKRKRNNTQLSIPNNTSGVRYTNTTSHI